MYPNRVIFLSYHSQENPQETEKIVESRNFPEENLIMRSKSLHIISQKVFSDDTLTMSHGFTYYDGANLKILHILLEIDPKH